MAKLLWVKTDVNRSRLLFEMLSRKEVQVAKQIAFGVTSKEICRVMGIAVKTLDVNRDRIKTKLCCERCEIPLIVLTALGLVGQFEIEV